jgi:hypothetical protein
MATTTPVPLDAINLELKKVLDSLTIIRRRYPLLVAIQAELALLERAVEVKDLTHRFEVTTP